MGLLLAGAIASLFGLMNIFARTLGGLFGDRCGIRWGLRGRVWFLGAVLLVEGLALILFSRMSVVYLAVPTLVLFSLFVQMSEGATFSVVPFVNKKALGAVAGIVGAGGNAGAVAAGFLFRAEGIEAQDAFLYIGVIVVGDRPGGAVRALLGPRRGDGAWAADRDPGRARRQTGRSAGRRRGRRRRRGGRLALPLGEALLVERQAARVRVGRAAGFRRDRSLAARAPTALGAIAVAAHRARSSAPASAPALWTPPGHLSPPQQAPTPAATSSHLIITGQRGIIAGQRGDGASAGSTPTAVAAS